MSPRPTAIVDANEAVASVAHRLSEVIAIYPITPSSAMGEHADEWSAAGRTNVWGVVPSVVEMQSEAGAAGAVHGALLGGALATTFTASQGLLLMIPELYKIAGELTPFVAHVAARAVATHALSIFGDHSDVMACRQTGVALLASASVQEAQDLAAIAHAVTLRARVPFLHFFDGFRTSHELQRIETLSDDDLRALVDPDAIAAHRARSLSPDRPVLRGTAQNPDAFFQAREGANPFYLACPDLVREAMDAFAARTGRRYAPFEWIGHPEAEHAVVSMGSSTETIATTVERAVARGERVGLLRVRLYRPFDVAAFADALPATVRSIAVLDRTKEPGAPAEPLALDVIAALDEAEDRQLLRGPRPRVRHGRYGLSGKELTPAMVRAIFDLLTRSDGPRVFTVGITDDVTRLSLPVDPELEPEDDDVVRAILWDLGGGGTVGATKIAIRVIGDEADGLERHVQAFFVYDSRKSGAVTRSHLRIASAPIRAPYLIRRATFVGCHHPGLLERHEVLEDAAPGATVLLNVPWPAAEVFAHLPREAQEVIVARGLRVFAVDAQRVSEEVGLAGRIGTIMQACFFALSGVLPRERGLARLREDVARSFAKRGDEIVRRNLDSIDRALERLAEVPVGPLTDRGRPPPVPRDAPDFVQRVTAALLAGHGDALPVSAFPPDGTWPTATSRYDKRALASELPVWDPSICIQCNKCAIVCPHSTMRTVVFDPAALARAPDGLPTARWKAADHAGSAYLVQVGPDDCTGCGLCVAVCPAKDKKEPSRRALEMAPAAERRELEAPRWEFLRSLPEPDRAKVHLDVKGSQLLTPRFEFPTACAGCGQTSYLALLSRLFGDRALIANATGCSSIYGGNLPTTPWSTDANGRGPAWANSLFEDDAEVGLGMRLAIDAQAALARRWVAALAPELGGVLSDALLEEPGTDEPAIARRREAIVELRVALAPLARPEARALEVVAEHLAPRSVWIVGGDGWAYDIGYGGLDHVLALGPDVNVLVLDTEVYSNTGGQQSKSTPLGAAAKFASAGKEGAKKDLGLHAMVYGNVYVASVALGAKDAHTVKAFVEAESWRGPSLILAQSPCIAHGYDLSCSLEHQKLAVASGMWPLYRFDPRRLAAGEPPLTLDSPPPSIPAREYMRREGRFRRVELADPERYRMLVARAERGAAMRRALYEQLAAVTLKEPEA